MKIKLSKKSVAKLSLIIFSLIAFVLFFFFLKLGKSQTEIFNVEWNLVEDSLTRKCYEIKIQNLYSNNLDFNLQAIFSDTNFPIEQINNVEIYEWKALPKEFPVYVTEEKCDYQVIGNDTQGNPIIDLICRNETVQNGTVTKNVCDWKPSKMQLAKYLEGEKEVLKTNNYLLNIPKFGSKAKYDDFGNIETVNGTKTIKICFNTPIVKTEQGWGSIGKIWLKDALGQYEDEDPWWNSTWLVRRNITINNTANSNTLTNYQVAINLTYDTDMQPDFSDIRFTWYNSTSGTEVEIPYWIESKVNSAWAYVWVKVPQIPANNVTYIFIYYSNHTPVDSMSNANKTFIIGDDFSSEILDDMWTWNVGQSGQSTYSLTQNPGWMRFNVVGVNDPWGTLPYTYAVTMSVPNISAGVFIIESRINTNCHTESDTCQASIFFTEPGDPDSWSTFGFYKDTPEGEGYGVDVEFCNDGTCNDAYRASGITDTDVWFRIVWDGSQYCYDYNLDKYTSSWVRLYCHNPFQTGRIGLWAKDWGTVNNFWALWDYFIVRKYSSPEPTYSIGAEETLLTINFVDKVKSFRPSEFINVSGINFVLGNDVYNSVGMNSYYLVDYATNHTYDDDGNEINNSRKYVLEILNEMHYLNLNLVRTWAGMECGSTKGYSVWDCSKIGGHYNAFQKYSPGNYSEEMYEALDWLLYEAGKRDIRVALVLVNNWNEYGGMRWYVQQSPTTNKTWENITDSTDDRWWEFHDQFYYDENCKQYFKNFINHTLWRKNIYTNIYYKDDPTIAFWILANEPRAKTKGSNYTLISNWTKEMADYIRSIDTKHLIGLGIEGWGNPWEGTHFIYNQNFTNISFATFNLNPYQWDWFAQRSEHLTDLDWADEGWNSSKVIDWWTNSTSLTYNNRYETNYLPNYNPNLGRHGYKNWVQQHIEWAHNNLSKPVLVQELLYPLGYGKVATFGNLTNYTLRVKFFNQTVNQIFNNGGEGVLFWSLYHDDYYWSTANSSYPGKMDDGFGFYFSNNEILRERSKPVIDVLNYLVNSGKVSLLNDYKYVFIYNPSGEIKNSTLYLFINNENGTSYTITKTNSTPIVSNANNTFEHQFQMVYGNSDKNFTFKIEVCGFSECINSSLSETVVLKTNSPIITLLTPNETTSSYSPTETLTLTYQPSSDLELTSCSLYIDDENIANEYNPTTTTLTFEVRRDRVGNHSWYVECKDIDSNIGRSETRVFEVRKAPVKISLKFNGTEGNKFIWNGSLINITAHTNISSKMIKLTTNHSGWVVQSGVEPLTNLTLFYDLTKQYNSNNDTVINVTAWFEGDENYTFASQTYYLIIDFTSPKYSNLIYPVTQLYEGAKTFNFNATCFDEGVGLDYVYFELDGVNYTPSKEGDVYYYVVSGLEPGTHSFRWYLKDLGNSNTNTTPLLNFRLVLQEAGGGTYTTTYLTDFNVTPSYFSFIISPNEKIEGEFLIENLAPNIINLKIGCEDGGYNICPLITFSETAVSVLVNQTKQVKFWSTPLNLTKGEYYLNFKVVGSQVLEIPVKITVTEKIETFFDKLFNILFGWEIPLPKKFFGVEKISGVMVLGFFKSFGIFIIIIIPLLILGWLFGKVRKRKKREEY
ncbi:MAG: DUF2341 domain-containing protein [Candidatus Aenigmatarchaeota archaeon]